MNSHKNINLYRSFSVPDISPSKEYKGFYTEKIIDSGVRFRRQISYEVIYDNLTGERISTIQFHDSPLVGSETYKKNYLPELQTTPAAKECKEVELNKVSPMEVETIDTPEKQKNSSEDIIEAPKIKKLEECLKKSVKTNLRTTSTKAYSYILLIVSFIVACLGISSFVLFSDEIFSCRNETVHIENIKLDLLTNVIAQHNAVKTIITSFESMHTWLRPMKIIPFIGTTGVGKTFIASLVKRNFNNKLVHDLKRSTLASYQLHSLHAQCCNLIVIDDLIASDTEMVIEFIKNLPKTAFVLVIPIFNVQGGPADLSDKLNEDDLNFIQNKFLSSDLYYETVIFDFFTKNDIYNWLSRELNKYNFDAKKKYEILDKLLLETDFISKGLKGLHRNLYLELGSLVHNQVNEL